MGKQRGKKNINFRETHSERSATNSYRNFGKFLKQKFYKQSLKPKGYNKFIKGSQTS